MILSVKFLCVTLCHLVHSLKDFMCYLVHSLTVTGSTQPSLSGLGSQRIHCEHLWSFVNNSFLPFCSLVDFHWYQCSIFSWSVNLDQLVHTTYYFRYSLVGYYTPFHGSTDYHQQKTYWACPQTRWSQWQLDRTSWAFLAT